MLAFYYPTKKALKESIGKELRYGETSMFGQEYQPQTWLTGLMSLCAPPVERIGTSFASDEKDSSAGAKRGMPMRLTESHSNQRPLTLEEARQKAEETWSNVYVTIVASWCGLKAFKVRLHSSSGPVHYLSQFGDVIK